MRNLKRLWFIAVVLAVMPAALFAQGFQVGNIAGTVTDQTGAALPGVTITIVHQERGTTRTQVTDAQGRYQFPALPLGSYRVAATLEGFQPSTRDVRVEQQKTTTTDLTMGLATTAESITVTAEAPVVDPTNMATTTRVSEEEFEKAPIGRSFQSIVALAPGISRSGGGNPNANGALSANNQYLFDGVDTTDPTTGTFGANINFEAIQEVNVMTTGMSAEYGRATGAVINVITKSGTNDFAGSLKAITTNPNWNSEISAKNQITGGSLATTRPDNLNNRYAATLGGPIWRDHIWFFGAYEEYKPEPSFARTTITNEEYSSARNELFQNYRLNAQLTPTQQVWAKWNEDPISGIVRTYTEGTDVNVLTAQGQGGEQRVVQYSGVFGANFSVDAMYGEAENVITVQPFRIGPFDNGAAVYDLTSRKYYNGNYFGAGNFVGRPREQFTAAATYFGTLGTNTHEIKGGVDLQDMESTSYYSYGNNRLYLVQDYNPATGTFTPSQRRDYVDPGPQTSSGAIDSIYLRDKFTIGRRLNLEVGLRYEQQDGANDVGVTTVETSAFAPRFALNYDLTGDARTLLTATAGRYNDWIIQSFSDNMAEGASRANYDLYSWNGATGAYDFVRTVITAGGNSITPNLDLEASHMDEYTLGIQRQLGATMGVTLRGVYRDWSNFVEDDYFFDEAGNIISEYFNYDQAERTYRALQTTFDKRFANNWSMYANYTYSQTEGNFFSNFASVLYDFNDNMCRGVTDTSIGTMPCSQAINTYEGRPSYDVPHVVNLLGTYGMNLGPVNLTFGVGGGWRSGYSFSKSNSVEVLDADGEGTGNTYTYYYEGLGSDRLPSVYSLDTAVEATFGFWRGMEVGVKAEAFNVTNNQAQIETNQTSWCNESVSSTACTNARNRFGMATGATHFQSPRSFRVTTLLRF